MLNLKLLCGEDFEYWVRCLRYTDIGYIDKILWINRTHNNNITDRLIRLTEGTIRRKISYFKRYHKFIEEMFKSLPEIDRKTMKEMKQDLNPKLLAFYIIAGEYKKAKMILDDLKSEKPTFSLRAASILLSISPSMTRKAAKVMVQTKLNKRYKKARWHWSKLNKK